jgi:hypothetical protein
MPVFHQGCVLEGFLIPADQRPNYQPLSDNGNVDWKAFEGKLVRFTVWGGGRSSRTGEFIKQPEVIGT